MAKKGAPDPIRLLYEGDAPKEPWNSRAAVMCSNKLPLLFSFSSPGRFVVAKEPSLNHMYIYVYIYIHIWVWLKTKQLGLCRIWFTFSFTRLPFWSRFFEPHPYIMRRESSARRRVPGTETSLEKQRRSGGKKVPLPRVRPDHRCPFWLIEPPGKPGIAQPIFQPNQPKRTPMVPIRFPRLLACPRTLPEVLELLSLSSTEGPAAGGA